METARELLMAEIRRSIPDISDDAAENLYRRLFGSDGLAWLQRWRITPKEPHGGHRYAAKDVITEYVDYDRKARADYLGNDVIELLARALVEHEMKLREHMGDLYFCSLLGAMRDVDPADQEKKYLEYLESIGKRGKSLAVELRAMSAEYAEKTKTAISALPDDEKPVVPRFWEVIRFRGEDDLDSCPRFIGNMAVAVWYDEVQPKAQVIIRRAPPALPAKVVTIITRGCFGNEDHYEELIRICPSAPEEIVRRKCFGRYSRSLDGHRALREIIHHGHSKYTADSKQNYARLEYRSREEFCSRAHIDFRNCSTKLPKMLDEFRYAEAKIELLDGTVNYYGLLMWEEYESIDKRCRPLSITLSSVLLPGFAAKLKGKTTSSLDTLLVPIPKPESIPLVGKRQDLWLAQANMQSEILIEFAYNSRKLASDGCIPISPEKFFASGTNAGLSPKVTQDVVNGLTNRADGQSSMFPLLVMVKTGHYTLGPGYKQEMDFLVAFGKTRNTRSAASKSRWKKKKTTGGLE